MTAEREGLAEVAGVLAEAQLPLAQAVWEGFKSSPFIDIAYRDAESIAATVLASDALADLLAARDRRVRAEALREAAAWVAGFGYPVEVRMPDNPPPAALWDALVDVIHEDSDGKWHGGELTRDEVDSWLREEAGA